MTTPARPSPILDLSRRVTPCLTVHDAAENQRVAPREATRNPNTPAFWKAAWQLGQEELLLRD